MTDVTVTPPTFEQLRDALGVGVAEPRWSFRTTADGTWRQQGYEVEVERGGTTSVVRVESAQSVLLAWPGAPLGSRERATVRVRALGADGRASSWSDVSTVEAGLLRAADWTARMITPAWRQDPDADAAPALLRREFALDGEVRSARLYITAHGVYEAELNGSSVAEDAMAPGWTSYDHRLRYQTYDVTDLLRTGANALGVMVADGWFRGRLGFHGGRRNNWGAELGVLAQLEVELTDGRRLHVVSDEDWRASTGPILTTSIYDGEQHDARRSAPGWSRPGFDDHDWSPVRAVPRDPATLVAPDGPPVRCTEEVAPVRVWRSPSGATLLDFGQNLVGRLRITVEGEAGHTVTLRHAEVLQDGELCTRPLRFADATDTYTLAGGGPETWEPRFTLHGFRYAEVDGWTGGDIAAHVVARVHHTDLLRAGWFECSDPAVNRLHENVVWSMRGNFVDVPTDCPQRDERLGWTGDIQVFAPTAVFLYQASGMLRGWLRDVAADQLPDGNVPWYVPYLETDEFCTPPRPSAVWGDVAVLTPWDVYQASGDVRVLEDQYDSALAWVDMVERRAGADLVWDADFQLGDWLDPAAPPEDPAAALTDPALVATAYFARSARTLARIAAVLGRRDDEDRYAALADRVGAAFRSRYYPGGGPVVDTQTAHALAISFDLLDADAERVAGDRLAELVETAGNRIATGFAGTPLVTGALTRTGHLERAYALLLERECPSWLYAVDQGATTIWERWDSQLPDGTVNPGEMTSFNHYALGAVAAWLHSTVAGLAATAPGYRAVRFAPRPGGGLTHASARHLSPYGEVAIAWRIDGERLDVDVEVPVGVDAVVDLPGQPPQSVVPGRHRLSVAHVPAPRF
ncbi:alpha-L-rhamnosidase [Nocardioides sp.]|uniref:alpha-L-rhamnosidase n=1 Tax=Nocardioides sp. TaxID=35761 RepID=UPI002EDA63CF